MTHTAPPSATRHQQPSQHFRVQRDVYCLWCSASITQSMFAGHKTELGWTQIASSFLQLLVNNNSLLLFFFCTRCAISVTQSSRTTTPNITAVPAGRASATAALPKLRPSPREAGVLALSESVTSASSRELHTQVHTLPIMSSAPSFSSLCDMQPFNVWLSSA